MQLHRSRNTLSERERAHPAQRVPSPVTHPPSTIHHLALFLAYWPATPAACSLIANKNIPTTCLHPLYRSTGTLALTFVFPFPLPLHHPSLVLSTQLQSLVAISPIRYLVTRPVLAATVHPRSRPARQSTRYSGSAHCYLLLAFAVPIRIVIARLYALYIRRMSCLAERLRIGQYSLRLRWMTNHPTTRITLSRSYSLMHWAVGRLQPDTWTSLSLSLPLLLLKRQTTSGLGLIAAIPLCGGASA
ncbi:hypothetical protein F4859DRAFT_431546 [Xylaria cf. heliscus]|nr:hypothetical protein F4859DRAFT_431546 [Xylaria cf. heliscus]